MENNQMFFNKKNRLFFIMVLLPFFVALIYYFFISVERYVSTSNVVVRHAGADSAPQVGGLALMLTGVNPVSREDTLYLKEYVMSTDMLQVLESKLNWSNHYSQQIKDPLFWLGEHAAQEDKLKFYRRMVTANFDDSTGLLKIEVKAYEPKFAQAVVQAINAESERIVNELSHRMARDQLAFTQAELITSRANYDDKQRVLLDFQNSNNVLDAEESAKSQSEIIAGLEKSIAQETTALNVLLANLKSSTPQVTQQRTRISALTRQMEQEKTRLISNSGGEKLNVVAARYRDLLIDAAIAEEIYKLGVAALENARIETAKKIRSLVVVVSPNLPERPIYPNRPFDLLTVFIGLCLVYGIYKFLVASIKDHHD